MPPVTVSWLVSSLTVIRDSYLILVADIAAASVRIITGTG